MNTQTLTWNHTRTGKPMTLTGTRGSLLVRVMMVRSTFPDHPMSINGSKV